MLLALKIMERKNNRIRIKKQFVFDRSNEKKDDCRTRYKRNTIGIVYTHWNDIRDKITLLISFRDFVVQSYDYFETNKSYA